MQQRTGAQEQDPNHHLFQRGDAWYVRYECYGRDERRSLGTSDVKKARKERDRILAEVAARRRGEPAPVARTWQQAVRGYLALAAGHVRSGKLTASTQRRYEVSIVQITLAVAGEPDDSGETPAVELEAITKATLLDFVEARRNDDLSSSTLLNDLTAWSRVLAYAEGKGWIELNVARAFDRRMFVGTNASELNPPTDSEVAMLVDEVGGWSSEMALLIRWLRETGMRLAEALQARAEDIHPDRLRITLSRGVKRGRVRTIHLGNGGDAARADAAAGTPVRWAERGQCRCLDALRPMAPAKAKAGERGGREAGAAS